MSSSASAPERISLDCGISLTRIVHWLDAELGLPRMPSTNEDVITWRYEADGGSCLIEASELDRSQIGPLRLERTLLEAHGGGKALASFQHRFTLRFMSAGG